MRRLLAVFVLPAVLLVPASAQAATVTVKEAANRKLVKIDKGDVLRVYLVENASTGYLWRRQGSGGPVLDYKGTKYFLPPVRPGQPMLVGEPGHRAFRYKAVKRGTTSVKISQFPPGSRKASKVYKITVKVS